jgi:adenosylcobinamide kinase/adenosylcobinamide-phosphate guanylyltransferase
MDLLLTGTGPATGFPVSGCPCATCRSVGRAAPGLSAGPDRRVRAPRRPAELQIAGAYRLDVDGVLHGPEGTDHHLRDGDRLELPGLVVRALAAAGSPISLLIHPDGDLPVLWAPQIGRLPEAIAADLAGIELGTVILGPAPDTDPDEPREAPDLIECALALSRLRAAGAVRDQTACLLVGLGHRQGPADRLAVCLRHWRAQAPPDGTPLPGSTQLSPSGTGAELDAVAAPGPAGRTLVLGGSASGKSAVAEDLLAAEPEVLYTATGPVVDLRTNPDADWAQRVRRHRERRPSWWRTEETHQVAALLAKVDQPILLDSVGTWLTGVLDRAGAWSDQAGWRDRVAAETDALVRAWRARRAPLVAVSDEVGLSVVPGTPAGRLFRDELGRLNRRLAGESEQVLVVVAGRLLTSADVLGET